MKLAVCAGLLAVAIAASGCGGDSEHANEPRPPTPIVASVVITPSAVAVTPKRLTAGPVLFTITNQAARSQKLQISSDAYSSGKPYDAITDPIQSNATSNFSTTLGSGKYEFTVVDGGISPAEITVGRQRASSSNELLIP